ARQFTIIRCKCPFDLDDLVLGIAVRAGERRIIGHAPSYCLVRKRPPYASPPNQIIANPERKRIQNRALAVVLVILLAICAMNHPQMIIGWGLDGAQSAIREAPSIRCNRRRRYGSPSAPSATKSE